MDESCKHQVSLRGASAKEISRDALLEKVSQERELRNYVRRATAAALFIQRVWRRYNVTKMASVLFQEEWEILVNNHTGLMTGTWISSSVLRPFLFFITCLSTRHQIIRTRDIECMQSCFRILLESINSTDSEKNFCSLAIGTLEERRTWSYQAQKLIFLCSFILRENDKSHPGGQDIVVLTSLAMRLAVVLTDLKGWKSINDDNLRDANIAVEGLIRFMGNRKSGLYICIRRYINKLEAPAFSHVKNNMQTDDKLLITASAITLALRPFHVTSSGINDCGPLEVQDAAEQLCLLLITIPWLAQRLPALLIPALKHQSVLKPCFQTLLHYDGDVKELCLDFTVTEESFGKLHVVELKPGGRDACVTNENKMQYVHAIADYKLNRQILPFSNAFYRGLTDLISPSWLKLFNASEFNQLLSGGNHDIDVDDLRSNTRYTGGYSEGSRSVKLFWEVITGFEPEERCMLLKFVTSCSRAPLLGFKYLQPAFTIHKVACDAPLWAMIGGQDVERLPSASTCYNTLKLPTYKRPSTLRAKLLYAISSNAGFELS